MLSNFRFNEKCGKPIFLCDMLILIFVFTFSGTVVCAQQSVNISGGNASGTGGIVSYSVGQIVYTTISGTNGSVAQGVQQPYEISIVTSIEEGRGIDLNCSVYPNPATNILILKVDETTMSGIKSLSSQLYDISGKLLENKKITGNETTISLVNYASATYFLKITDNHKEIKVFKIIKNQ